VRQTLVCAVLSGKHSDGLVDSAWMRGGSTWYQQLTVVIVALGVAGVWVFVDHPLEGPTLVTLSRNHGVHYTDALAIVPLLWAWRTVIRR
jgi:hypothetical protein